ncbi:MAG: HDOD domain-containing protein, partial [Desulfovibrionales bacterium]
LVHFPESIRQRIIGMDPALTTATLSLVNSPHYGLSNEIFDLERAAVVLGNREVLKLALSISFHGKVTQQLGRCGQDVMENWSLIIWSATAAQLLASRICPCNENRLYLSTLLKDISLLLICSKLPERLPIYKGNDPLLCLHPGQLEAERTAWGMTHAEMSSELLKEWGCPYGQCEGLVHHHDLAGVSGYDPATKILILATKWSEIEYQARTNPGLLIQFRAQLAKYLNLSQEEVDTIRSECIDRYRLYSKFLAPGNAEENSRQFDVPLDDLQDTYLMSLDFQHVKGGVTAIAETMIRHLRWAFDLTEWELGLKNVATRKWTFFTIDDGTIGDAKEYGDLRVLPWAKGAAEFKLYEEGVVFGEFRVERSKVFPELERKLQLYARLASITLQQYFQTQAIMESKAQTLELLPLGVALLDDTGSIMDANEQMSEFLQQKGALEGEPFWALLVKSRNVQMDSDWKDFLTDKKRSLYNRVLCPLNPAAPADQASFYLTAHRRAVGGMLVMVEDLTEVSIWRSKP